MPQDKKAKVQQSGPTKAAMMSAAEASTLPPAVRVRLYELFVQIEREFEILYAENVSLQEKIDRMPRQQAHAVSNLSSFNANHAGAGGIAGSELVEADALSGHIKFQTVAAGHPTTGSKTLYAHKIRSHTNKLRAQTNRIMSNLKGQALNCSLVRRYNGHKDGIWEVSVSRMGLPILGTASADHTAMIWGMHSGQPLLQYTGHTGSVNSLRFHPNKELVITASGDGSVHIWQCAVHLYNESSSGRVASSEDELDPGEKEFLGGCSSGLEDDGQFSVLRTPLRSLNGHSGVAIAADWLPGGEQAVTAGWDKLACIWDTQTGELLQQLSGHDEELTHAATHPSSRLVVTSSKDCTFRLWDFRESIHSVSVFQGHQDTVTSAVFTHEANQVVSGSDDRSARIWDLRNMRTPVAMIQSDSSVNRISVSQSGLIAIPFDNRNVRIYDLNGNRIARLPRSSRQGHSRMACCTAWSEETKKPNLFTCGFDRVVLGWSIKPREVKDDASHKLNLSLKGNRELGSNKESHLGKENHPQSKH